MSALSYNAVKTFKEANMAICVDMSLDADYKHQEFYVQKVEDKVVELKSVYNDDVFKLPIKFTKRYGGYEYTEFAQSSSFEAIFKRKPHVFEVVPIQGKFL